jgi:predicted amidohydrolase YtcJ
MLDAVVPDRPVFLTSADGHTAWVNSAALQLAGLSADTPDPKGGRIERDPGTGDPTGTLREAAADLVGALLPPHRPDELEVGLRRGLELAAGFGITAFQEATAGPDYVEAYDALARSGELTARVSVSLHAVPEKGLSQVAELVALRDRFNGERLRVNTVKLYVDGVLEGQTAALLEPYIGRGGDRGELLFEPDALNELVAALDAEGFQVHVHAIGDWAIRVTLDAFEHAVNVNGVRDSRHHIAHAQLIRPDDIPRFRRLGVYANFQPLWAYADSYITDLTEPFLGPELSRWLYPFGGVKASGATVVFGSDWSVSSMNPLEGIEVGVTRRDPTDASAPVWIPEERVDLETMLVGYTRDAALVNFIEGETGTLEVGKSADLVVLARDLYAILAEEIGEVPVLLTMLEGEIIYRRAGL